MLNIQPISVLQDNYSYLLWDGQDACVIDPGDAKPIMAALRRLGLRLRWILNTHHHMDHVAGNPDLKKAFSCEVYSGSPRTLAVDQVLKNQTNLNLGKLAIRVLYTPGHTQDGVCFYFPDNPGMLFTGDTLFIGGCGRLFESSAQDLWHSLRHLQALPNETLIYCGHEYTLENYAFALSLEPEHAKLKSCRQTAEAQRQMNQPTVPSTLAIEKLTNPFLRANTVEDLATCRRLKDHF